MTDFSNALHGSEALLELLSGITVTLRAPSSLLGIAGYVLSALALYTIAQRRGIRKPWLSWIPGINCWILGSLSDQYQYVVNGQTKSKRKALLTLSILNIILSVMVVVLAVALAIGAFLSVDGHAGQNLAAALLGPLLGVLALCIPILGIALAFFILRCMALYDVYKSLDPSNCVLFLVLSIIFQFTEPFFLFFNREKEGGMPPRKDAPAPAAPSYEYTYYQTGENKDYL